LNSYFDSANFDTFNTGSKGPVPPQVYEPIHQEYTAALDQASLQLQRPLLEFLAARGFNYVRIGGPPIVQTTVPKSLLSEIEARPEVIGISSAEGRARPAGRQRTALFADVNKAK